MGVAVRGPPIVDKQQNGSSADDGQSVAPQRAAAVPSVSAAQIGAYFSKCLSARTTVLSVRPTFPGMSRETLLVKAEVAGRPEGFVLRLDYPWGSASPFSLRHEWNVYYRLWKSPVPVAEPLWFDENSDFAQGRPHMVRRMVEGSTAIAGLSDPGPDGVQVRRRVALEWAEKMALLHSLDWVAHGFGDVLAVPPDTSSAMVWELNQWRDLWKAAVSDPYPAVEEAFFWLRESLPRDTPKISLLKGNNGVGEEIWQGTRIVALSDWEVASLGDGASDLAFSQGTLMMGDLRETLRCYESGVGHQVSPERLAGAMFLVWFKQVVSVLGYVHASYQRGVDSRIGICAIGAVFAKSVENRLSRCIGRNLIDAWTQVAGKELSLYWRVGNK
jgi:aminoglycoside phosphotransferase (APT) family kinase protein